jgi:hypothetical protein
MSTTPPNQPAETPNRPGDPADKTDVQPPFEEQLRAIWEKKENRTAVFAGCAIVVAVILGWYGYKALAAERETQIETAYSAAVTPARLRAFRSLIAKPTNGQDGGHARPIDLLAPAPPFSAKK